MTNHFFKSSLLAVVLVFIGSSSAGFFLPPPFFSYPPGSCHCLLLLAFTDMIEDEQYIVLPFGFYVGVGIHAWPKRNLVGQTDPADPYMNPCISLIRTS